MLLASNILEVPKFFWESEPTLHPLYFAIREYLEIAPRIKVLNERCRVFLDLAEILSDNFADMKMSTITIIVIVLIIISILITTTEVGLRFLMLRKGGQVPVLVPELHSATAGRNWSREDFSETQLQNICGAAVVGTTFMGV